VSRTVAPCSKPAHFVSRTAARRSKPAHFVSRTAARRSKPQADPGHCGLQITKADHAHQRAPATATPTPQEAWHRRRGSVVRHISRLNRIGSGF
jgi:hypothetical protein